MQQAADGFEPGRRVRVERGICRQANGKYAACFMLDGKPRVLPLFGSRLIREIASRASRLRELAGRTG